MCPTRLEESARRILPLAVALACAGPGGTGVRASPLLDPESLRDAREGLDHLYHARIERAVEAMERIRRRHPESPATDFLLGGIEWHRVTTGPSGFAEGGESEESFFARMDAAIELGEEAVRKDPDDLSARFFLGGAYGYEARYLAIQEKWWRAYRTGRRGVGHLEYVVEHDPDLADAYLGLGIYHYYTDVLPSVLKVLGTLVGLKGDRERGLTEIHRALSGGELVPVECRFFLAEIYTTFEEDHWRALEFSRSLRDEYPENELFAWMHARVLDDLHLTDLAAAEWTLLRSVPRGRRLRGFLDYRLARSRLFGGDFAGAAARLEELLRFGRLGSPRITMWGRLRYGMALDFLGRHEEAMKQYALAREMKASRTAEDRADKRLAAGRSDPARISLTELQETARILMETGAHGEEALRLLEQRVTGPSRGLSSIQRDLFFDVLRDLAEARLRRGDPEGALAAVDRALDLDRRPPKAKRAVLLALRARALFRTGRAPEAEKVLGKALSRASYDDRRWIRRDRELIRRLAGGPPPGPDPVREGRPVTFTAPDRGELLLEVEGDFLPAGTRLPMTLQDGVWTAHWRAAPQDTIRYRFVADGERRRIDPRAPLVVLAGDSAWCLVPGDVTGDS